MKTTDCAACNGQTDIGPLTTRAKFCEPCAAQILAVFGPAIPPLLAVYALDNEIRQLQAEDASYARR